MSKEQIVLVENSTVSRVSRKRHTTWLKTNLPIGQEIRFFRKKKCCQQKLIILFPTIRGNGAAKEALGNFEPLFLRYVLREI